MHSVMVVYHIWCGMHNAYLVVGIVGIVGMHANDLLMNSSTVSRHTELNSDAKSDIRMLI